MERTSNKLLKVTGILMIIGGAFSIIFGIIAVLGVGALAAFLGSEANMGVLVLSSTLMLISGVVSLIAGILGVKHSANPQKAQTCIIFGGITAALSVLSSILNVAGGNSFNLSGLITGLILPVLYLIGAFQNKHKSA